MTPFPWHRDLLSRLASDRAHMPHALLVKGPAGIGKVEFSRALAAAVLCESPAAGLACGKCPSCHWFSQGNHPDFREIVPEASAEDDEEETAAGAKEKAKSVFIKIDQVRAVADFLALSTHRAGFRVLLMHPAESMHPNAANSLLKSLEEPPPGTLIILVSDRPARLLATLRSRCRQLALAAPPREEALAWLRAQDVAQPEAALAAAGGAPLLAAELAAPEEADFRRRLAAELSRPSGADPLGFAPAVDRLAVERFLHTLQTWVHDLIRARLAGDVRHHVEHAAAIRTRARASSIERLLELDRELAGARALASHPLNPRLLAEHLLLAYNRATQP
jgi:DNA polymerase III subunit delta'